MAPYTASDDTMTDHNKLQLFNEPHMVGIILYIRDHPCCRRTELYKNVARNDRMSVKLDILISEGIVEDLSKESRSSTLMLTPTGEKVADRLQSIIDLLER